MSPPSLLVLRLSQADGRLPAEARRHYKSVGDAIVRIVREEGVVSLWKGCGPTVYRAMAVTAGQVCSEQPSLILWDPVQLSCPVKYFALSAQCCFSLLQCSRTVQPCRTGALHTPGSQAYVWCMPWV